MYDLEIIVPAETNNQMIIERFDDFKKWGFQNIGNTKIKLILLASNDNKPDCLMSGWPNGIDVETIITPYKHVAQRIHYYYSELIKPDTAYWYMRIDEDSMNDIGGLMKNLEVFFDPDREYHMGGEIEYGEEETEKQVLSFLGYKHWFRHESDYPPHEHEASVTSNAAIKRIFSNPATKQYFTKRLEIEDGVGDHGLCYCARMSKVHAIKVNFLTREPAFCKFSLYGGQYNHIHWIAKDQNPCIFNWLNIIDKTKLELFSNKKFLFIDSNKNEDENYNALVKLNKNQSISIIDEKEDSDRRPKLWGVNKEGNLNVFFNEFEKNNPLITFKNMTNGLFKFKNYKLIEKALPIKLL